MAIGMAAIGPDLHLKHPLPWHPGSVACSAIRGFLNHHPDAVVNAVQLWAAARHDEYGP